MFAPKYKRIFVLGAGFSKAFSEKMPLIKDLSEGILTTGLPAFKKLKFFANRYHELSNSSGEFSDYENLGTILFTKRIFKDFNEEMEYLQCQNIYLQYIYHQINGYEIDAENYELFLEFLKLVSFSWRRRGNQEIGENLIVTFNYDLLIEGACENEKNISNRALIGPAGYDYGISMNKYESGRFIDANDRKIVDLIKLHGSFNWFKAKGADTTDHHYIYKVNKDDPNFGIHKHDTPCFIPMAHSKDSFLTGTLYNTLWAKATSYFNEAEEIIFIGYGFPTTDLNNLTYFLPYKEKIKAINVLEPLGSPKLRRLQNIFGEGRIKNMNAKEYIRQEILGA